MRTADLMEAARRLGIGFEGERRFLDRGGSLESHEYRLIISKFAPNSRKLLPKHVEKSCDRRRRLTGRTDAYKVKSRRLWLNWDKRDAGLVHAANGTRPQGNTNSGGYHHQHCLDPFRFLDNSWRKTGICAEQHKSVY